MSTEELWELLISNQGFTYHTAKGLKFKYCIRGYEMFIDRKKKSLTRSSVVQAYEKVKHLGGHVSGPKKLGVFGASYIYPVFIALGIITDTEK